jgi:hypothetical protein
MAAVKLIAPLVFEKEARSAFDDLDKARMDSLTPPEWCFKRAQKKVQTGDYDADPIDQTE